MGVEDVYLTAGVNRTGGYAVKFTGQTFQSRVRRVRIDYHFHGVWVDDSSKSYGRKLVTA
jgi:hypothetical protein